MATKQSKSSAFPQIPGYDGDFIDTNPVGPGTGSSTEFTTPITPDQLEDSFDIKTLVVSSEIYKRVYAIFSKLSDPYWLNQLQSIIDSLQDPQSTFWDKLGLSTSFEDKKDAIYSEAISQISQLYASYQQYINSLPTTQVQQLLNAGSNSIVNGGLSTSSLETDITPNSGEQIQRDTAGEFTEFLDSIMNLSTGIFGFAQSVQSIFQSHSLFPSVLSRSELGVKSSELGLQSQKLGLQSERADLAGKGVFVPLQDDDSLDPESLINLGYKRSAASKNSLSDYLDSEVRSTLSGYKFDVIGQEEFKDVLRDIAKLEVLNRLSGLQKQESQNQFDLTVLGLKDPVLEASALNESNRERVSTAKLTRFRNTQISDMIKKYMNNDSMLGNYMLYHLSANAPIDYRAIIADSVFSDDVLNDPNSNIFDILTRLLHLPADPNVPSSH